MDRVLCACVALAFAVPAGSAPNLKDVPDRPYYPTTVGDRWVMELRGSNAGGEYTQRTTEVVTAVEKNKDGDIIVSVSREVDGKFTPKPAQMKVSSNGLFRISVGETVFDTPYCVLKLPLKSGEKWTSEVKVKAETQTTFKYEVAKEEEVEVPAGKFRATRINVKADFRGSTSKYTIWYVPQIGSVKEQLEGENSKHVREMKSFKRGK